MTRRPVWYRPLVLLWAVLQLALPVAASLGDAAVAVAAAQDPAASGHVEESTGDQCGPVHAADCKVCRALADSHGLPSAAPAELPRLERVQRLVSGDDVRAVVVAGLLPPARAPPSA
jgi:hypothetical protein